MGAMTVNESDGALWNLITDVPKVHTIIAYVCFVLNIFPFPGVGSIVVGCIGDRITEGA